MSSERLLRKEDGKVRSEDQFLEVFNIIGEKRK